MHRTTWALMLLCLLIAASLRFPALSTYPPGLHYDEAANGILAAEIGVAGERPIFISSYTGKESLFFYLAGGLMRLLGVSVWTLRLTAAFVGVLTVAATYSLGRQLGLNRNTALLAAALLAVSFWHLLFSRLGFRAITQPLLQAVTLLLLFRGLRLGQWPWFAASGVCLGLLAYTYLAARLFPILLLIGFVPILMNGKQLKRHGQHLLLMGGLAMLTIAPLLGYFLANPDAFWVRITQVTATNAATLSWTDGLIKSFGMLFIEGDPYWRFNVPQRPLFDWFWGSCLLLGWGLLIWRWRQQQDRVGQTAVLLLIVAPFIMLLPTALATNEILPSNLRAIGLIPFIFYLPAYGLMAVVEWGAHRWPRLVADNVVMVVSVLLLGMGGLMTAQRYFREWGQLPALFYESDGDLAAVASYLNLRDSENVRLYVAAQHYQHPTLAFLSQRYDDIKWLPHSEALVFPPDKPAIYIYPYNSPKPHWADPYLTDEIYRQDGPDLEAAFTVYRRTQPPALTIPNPVSANFSNVMTLLGYEVGSGPSGTTLPLTLYWRVDSVPPDDFTPFVHMEDAWRYRWSQVEPFAYPPSQWEPGETIIQRVSVPITAGTPPGIYRLRIGLFHAPTGQRLAQFDENGRYAGDTFIVENVFVLPGPLPDSLPQPTHTLDLLPRAGLRFLGYERGGATVATGENLFISLWWLATEVQPELVTRLELMRPDNTGRILVNTQPVHDTYPFHQWQTPQFLVDHISPRIPEDILAGDYRLSLRLLDGNNNTLLSHDLGPLAVTATERQFDPPAVTYPFSANFSNEIAMIGYELTQIGERTFELKLIWRGLDTPKADYTVFVHVLNKDGTCCAWQADVMPQQNGYPTSRWLTDEVVVDSYEITLPEAATPGSYPIELGLYMAENGRRLQVTVPDQPTRDAIYLFPVQLPE